MEMFNALLRRDEPAIRDLINSGYDVNEIREGGNASSLQLAIDLPCSTAIINLLLDAGANVGPGTRMLLFAIKKPNLEAVDLIIQHGIDVNEVVRSEEWLSEWSCLNVAACISLELVKRLVDAGAELDLRSSPAETAALHRAACYFKPDIVKYLLERGANVNILDVDDSTPLLHALESKRTPVGITKEQVLSLLMQYGARYDLGSRQRSQASNFNNAHLRTVRVMIVLATVYTTPRLSKESRLRLLPKDILRTLPRYLS